jgi:hypothetical protein
MRDERVILKTIRPLPDQEDILLKMTISFLSVVLIEE